MKVIVAWEPNYDGGAVYGVFSSKEKADEWVQKAVEFYSKNWHLSPEHEKLISMSDQKYVARRKKSFIDGIEFEAFDLDSDTFE